MFLINLNISKLVIKYMFLPHFSFSWKGFPQEGEVCGVIHSSSLSQTWHQCSAAVESGHSSSERARRRPAMSNPARHALRVARPCIGANVPSPSYQRARLLLACRPLQEYFPACLPTPRNRGGHFQGHFTACLPPPRNRQAGKCIRA